MKEIFNEYKPRLDAWKSACEELSSQRGLWQASQDPEALYLPPARMTSVQGMAHALLTNEGIINGGLLNGHKELSFFTTCPETGAYLRARTDVYDFGTGMVVDVKKCKDASESGFRSAVATYSYHVQVAFYWHVLKTLGIVVNDFLFACVEPQNGHKVAVYGLCNETIEQGRREAFQAIATWLKCRETGIFPGYPEGICCITLPGWRRDSLFDQ